MGRNLDGKIAIIIGALGGLGRAQVELFARQGATVVATDLDTSSKLPPWRTDYRVAYQALDVTSEEGWREIAADWTTAEFGRIDLLVNNAGVFRAGTVEETTVQLMDVHYRVNELGPFLGMAAVIPTMKAQGSGAIVNISSLAGMKGVPGQFAYAASKRALRGMTKCAAADLGGVGIRVNSVHPGMVDTPILRRIPDEVIEYVKAMIPSGMLGQPTDIAPVVAFLASDAAAYVNGAEIAVDSGLGL